MKKVIIAQLSIKPSNHSDFLKLIEIMTTKSLQENGCMVYTVYRAISNENEFIIYENYKNDESVAIHNSSDHFKKCMNEVMPMLTKEPIIELF